jgi:AcrR family transcriptional regulator
MNIHSAVAMTEPAIQIEPSGGKREAILDAALDLFAERGFHGTAVPLVAKRANVGAGTVYRYFESKEALVNALYQREKQAFVLSLCENFPDAASPREKFRELWKRLWAFASEHQKSAIFLELHHHADYLDEQSLKLEEVVMQPILDFVRQSQANQALKDVDPQLLIAVVYGAFIQVVKAIWLGQLANSPETLMRAEACVWEAVRA